MEDEATLIDLLDNGIVVKDIEGSSTDEIYKNICNLIKLPNEVSKDSVYAALCDRERVMSTAVGYGIALPHCRGTILKNNNEQQISICYLKNTLDMKAPDTRHVYVMFVILTSNSKTHLQVLSQLASLFNNSKFRSVLESHADKEEILKTVQEQL